MNKNMVPTKIKRQIYLTPEANEFLLSLYTQSIHAGKKISISGIIDQLLREAQRTKQ